MSLQALGYAEASTRRIVERFRQYDERHLVESAPHRHDMKKLIALGEQGRRDIAELLAADARLAPQVHEDDPGAHQQGGEQEARA
jgi:hypothetical protein